MYGGVLVSFAARAAKVLARTVEPARPDYQSSSKAAERKEENIDYSIL